MTSTVVKGIFRNGYINSNAETNQSSYRRAALKNNASRQAHPKVRQIAQTFSFQMVCPRFSTFTAQEKQVFVCLANTVYQST